MTDNGATQRLHGHIAGSLLFLCLAFAGWGAFIYELRASGGRERDLAAQVMRLEAETARIAAERDQWLAAHGRQQNLERDLSEMRGQIEAARSQVAALTRSQAQDRSALEAARAETASLNEQLAVANDRASRTASVPTSKRRFRRGRSR